jgi:hypothetical protein
MNSDTFKKECENPKASAWKMPFKVKRARGLTQVVECLPSKLKTLQKKQQKIPLLF